jgi:hypothetical protein
VTHLTSLSFLTSFFSFSNQVYVVIRF